MADRPKGHPTPTSLVDARLQLHWAAQLLAAVANVHGDRVDDDSHTNLAWEDGALHGRPIAGCRVSLQVDPLTVVVEGLAPRTQWTMAGRSLPQALEWLRSELAGRVSSLDRPLERPGYDLFEHPVGEGTPFDPEPAALAELARWYGWAAALLAEVEAAHPEAGELRVWPHHFDLATLLTIDAAEGKRLGVGFSPGDGGYAEPYLYVLPWPPPEVSSLPELPVPGGWHREGWVGAVLIGSQMIERSADAGAFLRAAVEAARSLVGTEP